MASNPADDLIDSIKGAIDGGNIRKRISDVWDSWTQGKQSGDDSDEAKMQSKQMNQDTVDRATKSFQTTKTPLNGAKMLGARKRTVRRATTTQKASKTF